MEVIRDARMPHTHPCEEMNNLNDLGTCTSSECMHAVTYIFAGRDVLAVLSINVSAP